MNKAIFLLVLVFALLLSVVACTPKQNEQELSVGTVQTTATKNTSDPENTTDPVDTDEKETGKQSGGLQVGEDTDKGFGEFIPLG